jgi:hypothetical protein
MTHASRDQPGHNQHDQLVKSQCLSLISEHLLGFGPTLAHEKYQHTKRLKRPYQPCCMQWLKAQGKNKILCDVILNGLKDYP